MVFEVMLIYDDLIALQMIQLQKIVTQLITKVSLNTNRAVFGHILNLYRLNNAS